MEEKLLHPFEHQSVLLQETVDAVLPVPGGRYVDCTLGGGGHTFVLLEKSAPSGQVLAIDQDPVAISHAEAKFELEESRLVLVHSNFRELCRICEEHGFTLVDGVVMDLGVSSPQFDDAMRGFSYKSEAALDMRMDTTQGQTAADLVNETDEASLARIFWEYGEERFARRIAQRIVRRRVEKRIEYTVELAELVKDSIPAAARRSGPHPARRVFQALRIAVNDELNALRDALSDTLSVLRPGGRVAVITFHSLEDRIVKQSFAEWAQGCICPPDFPICQCNREPKATLVTRRPILPSPAEIERNPRARSAKLRVAQKR